jgi:hypothetical protein
MVALLLSIGLRNQGDKKEEGGTDSVIFCVHRECLAAKKKNVGTFLCRSFDSSGAGKVGGHPLTVKLMIIQIQIRMNKLNVAGPRHKQRKRRRQL